MGLFQRLKENSNTQVALIVIISMIIPIPLLAMNIINGTMTIEKVSELNKDEECFPRISKFFINLLFTRCGFGFEIVFLILSFVLCFAVIDNNSYLPFLWVFSVITYIVAYFYYGILGIPKVNKYHELGCNLGISILLLCIYVIFFLVLPVYVILVIGYWSDYLEARIIPNNTTVSNNIVTDDINSPSNEDERYMLPAYNDIRFNENDCNDNPPSYEEALQLKNLV